MCHVWTMIYFDVDNLQGYIDFRNNISFGIRYSFVANNTVNCKNCYTNFLNNNITYQNKASIECNSFMDDYEEKCCV